MKSLHLDYIHSRRSLAYASGRNVNGHMHAFWCQAEGSRHDLLAYLRQMLRTAEGFGVDAVDILRV